MIIIIIIVTINIKVFITIVVTKERASLHGVYVYLITWLTFMFRNAGRRSVRGSFGEDWRSTSHH